MSERTRYDHSLIAAAVSVQAWSRASARVFQPSTAHLMRTGNFTTPCSASRSPRSMSSSPGCELDVLDAHHRPEPADHRPCLADRLADDGLGHHRCRRLRDRAALAADLDVADHGVVALAVDEEVQRDLVATQRVVAARLDRRRRLEFTTVPRRAVVIENDLAVEVFEARHQNPKISVALSSASARASTSSVPLYR